MKPFKTIDEQLRILENRNLIIDDYDSAKLYLSTLNYYRISGYTLTLRKDDIFYPGVNFSDIIQIYEFDKKLKYLLLYYLEDVEIALRTHLAYILGSQGPDCYKSKDTFASEEHFEQILLELESCKTDNRYEAFIKYHSKNREGKFPIWVLTETLSFGALSRLFCSLNVDIKKEICKTHYGPLRHTYLENWLESLVVLRNICAHHSRLYNRGLPKAFKFSSQTLDLFRSQGYESTEIGKKVFFAIPIISYMIPFPEISNNLISNIENLCEEYPFVNLKHYGFKPNWKDNLRSVRL